MGLFDLFRKKQEPYSVQYYLHIVCIVEDWNQMQQRDFVAVDIQKQLFYRVHEVVGSWGESRYIIKQLEDTEVRQLFDLAAKCSIKIACESFVDWSSFAASLQNTEVIEITKEQILYSKNFEDVSKK